MYLGTFDSFEFTAAADTPVDAIVKNGALYGVTKAPVANGEKGLAFMGKPAPVYVFTITALGSNGTLGQAVYVDGDNALTFSASDGSSPATAYHQIGYLWKAYTSTDTEIYVALI